MEEQQDGGGGFSPVTDGPEVEPMDELEKLRYEKELLGFLSLRASGRYSWWF